MDEMKRLIEELKVNNHLTLEEVPDLDLYMDQVIQLFERKYEDMKRNDKEKVLTKTMINNYAKGKLFFPITNKKYSRDHLILISMIYQLKGALSISDIKTVLEKLNHKIVEEDDFNLDHFYKSYLHMSDQNQEAFKDHVQNHVESVENQVKDLNDQDSEHLEQVLTIASLVNMSNMYRRAAEKLADQMIEVDSKDKN